jgi:hypothetical protein
MSLYSVLLHFPHNMKVKLCKMFISIVFLLSYNLVLYFKFQMIFQFKKQQEMNSECELTLYYLNEEFPTAGATAEDSGRADRS